VWRWLYERQATDPAQMTTLPPTLRERLADETVLTVPRVLARQEDPEGQTRKDLLELEDGAQIEVVLLRYRERYSACISTQVGCGCACAFCATGQMGFVRQLTSAEIVAQVLHLQRELGDQENRLSNVVLMGMGEPLLNYEQTSLAVQRMVDPRAVGLAPGRVTLSTVGIAPEIERLARDGLPIKLAISLHAATDELRDRLVPINRRYPLDELFAAARTYIAQTQLRRRSVRVLFEWVLIDGVNDTPEQAQALIARLDGMPAHVNLIQLNPTSDFVTKPAPPESTQAFAEILDRAGIPHTMRQRRGGSIEAGCGQLRSRHKQSRSNMPA
jgi:23S rRNA (adenine2503-C2)-methyltransferase